MRVYGMQVNHIARPLGFDLTPLRFSYKVACEGGKRQQSARVRVYGPDESVVYDSGTRQDIDSLCFAPDIPLSPRTRYTWDVAVTADTGETALSPRAWFETAKQQEPWLGQWIAAPREIANARLVKRFTLPGRVVSARLYICGLGLYEAFINGQKAGDEYLAPGCNKYDSWLQYQTYDVTDLLAEDNEIAVLLGDGWYKGRFGFQGQKEIFGNTQALICELHAALDNGAEIIIPSDDTWRCGESPVLFSNIYDGETWDASKPLAAELPARLLPDMDTGLLRPRMSPPVRAMLTLRPAAVLHTPAGETVLDMGQEITGFVTFRAAAERGHTYTLRYGEILQDGCFYTDNLRTARQTFTYICDGQEAWARPHFTFFGFRYIKLEGFGEEIDLHDFVGCVLYSDMEQTAFIRTASDKVNRLCENALWGQRGNFVDVPTDCPQRDERMGWTGDAQVFCATACYQMSSAAFYAKFMRDMAFEQRERGGGVPHVVPSFGMQGSPACAWADAGSIIPWTVYQFFGDTALLREQYDNMKLWVEWIHRVDHETGDHRLWQAGFHFADWLALDAAFPASCTGGTDPDFIASAFYLYSTRLTRKAAAILGYAPDAARYAALEQEILAAIRQTYRAPKGGLTVNTQTAHILSLFLGLMPESDTPILKAALDRLFENARNELRTGFVGTAYLCSVLTQAGFNHLAYTLFLNENYPGWLYEVNMGATTVWERWNSVMPDGHMSSTGMNSLNHYAYGAVMEWVCRDAAGLAPVEDAPGFRKALMHPHPDTRLGEIDFSYESAIGRYRTHWKTVDETTFDWELEVPFGAQAEAVLPLGTVTGSDADWQEQADGCLHAVLESGSYAFHCVCAAPYSGRLLLDVPFEQLLKHDDLREEILTIAPELTELKAVKNIQKMSLRQLRSFPFSPLAPWKLKRLEQALNARAFG